MDLLSKCIKVLARQFKVDFYGKFGFTKSNLKFTNTIFMNFGAIYEFGIKFSYKLRMFFTLAQMSKKKIAILRIFSLGEYSNFEPDCLILLEKDWLYFVTPDMYTL